MSSTCFEPQGSSSGRQLYVQYGTVCFTCISIRVEECFSYSYRTHSSIYKTAYTDACKTDYTIPVYTTVFLKMNTRNRNM